MDLCLLNTHVIEPYMVLSLISTAGILVPPSCHERPIVYSYSCAGVPLLLAVWKELAKRSFAIIAICKAWSWQGSFGSHYLRVRSQTESDGHVTVSAATNFAAWIVHNARMYVRCLNTFMYATSFHGTFLRSWYRPQSASVSWYASKCLSAFS